MAALAYIDRIHQAGIIDEIDWKCPKCDADNYDERPTGEVWITACESCGAKVEISDKCFED